MDSGSWRATVRGVARVGHDLVTKPHLTLQDYKTIKGSLDLKIRVGCYVHMVRC